MSLGMKESDWRYIVDVILFVCLGGMTLIGILLGLVIPAGPAAAGGFACAPRTALRGGTTSNHLLAAPNPAYWRRMR